MAEVKPDPKWVGQELEKLPARQPRGSESNILRAVAAGFIFMGYTAEESIPKAKAVIEFYDNLSGGEHEQGNQGRGPGL